MIAIGVVNPRWVDIPETQIIKTLAILNLNTWHCRKNLTNAKYYLHSGEGYSYPYSLPEEIVWDLASQLNEKWINMEWHKRLTQRAIEYYEANTKPENQALEYWEQYGKPSNLPKPEILTLNDLDIGKPNVGAYYLAVLGLYKLTLEIAPEVPPGSLHHLYIELIDEAGKRIRSHIPPLFLWYEWEGMRPEEKPNPVQIDKPLQEPGANISIGWKQVIRGFYINNIGCEQFKGIHTRYPNGDGHHSHFIVLRKQRWQTTPKPPDPDPPEPQPKKLVMAIDKDWLDKQPVKDGHYQIYGIKEENK